MPYFRFVPSVLLAGLLALLALSTALGQALPVQQLQQRQAAERADAERPPGGAGLEEALRPTVRRLVAEELARQPDVAPAPAAAPAAEAQMADPFAMVIDRARGSVENLSRNAARLAEALPALGDSFDHAFILMTDLEGWPRMWEGVANLAAMLAAAALLMTALRRLLRRIMPLPRPAADDMLSRLWPSLVLMVRDTALVAAFVAAGFLLSLVWFAQHDPMRIFLITYLGAFATALTGRAVARFLFSPDRPEQRLVEVDDRTARKLALWLTALFATVGLVGFSVGMVRLLGMPPATIGWMLLAAGLFTVAITAALTMQTSRPDAPTEAVDAPRSGRYRRLWLMIGLGFLALLWGLAVLSADGTKLLAVVVIFTAAAASAYFGVLRRPPPAPERPARAAIPLDPEEMHPEAATDEPEAPEAGDVARPAPPPSLLPPVRRVVQSALGLVGALAFLHLLGVDMVAAQQSPTGERITAVLGDVAVILIVAAIGWALVERTIRRFVEREEAKARAEAEDHAIDEDGLGGMVTSRFGTLLPLIRGFILSVLAAVTIMVVLSSMGLDIGPLLAGAGVVGIAIGFGAQALVRDIIAGIFFLIDDAFRVGEYVEFSDIRGQVEQISIRSMRLRHHRGAIHTIPFGELRSITNYNRDWAIYKQEFRLPYETDTDKVRKIIKKVGIRLMEDPELGPKFIQPLKSQGVFKIEEGALIVRTKFMCKPREQFIIRKAVFQEVKNDLYQAGIELAQRRVQIEWPEWVEKSGPGGPADGGPGGKVTDGGPDAPSPIRRPGQGDPVQAAMVGAAVGAAGLVISQQTTKPVYPDEP